jgi:hypothetical protein
MTVTEQILKYKHDNQPFTVHLSDGRRFLVPHADFVSTHPGGKGTNLIIYGTAENEEHFIPIFAVASISINGTT